MGRDAALSILEEDVAYLDEGTSPKGRFTA
jgi:hypothetical protein